MTMITSNRNDIYTAKTADGRACEGSRSLQGAVLALAAKLVLPAELMYTRQTAAFARAGERVTWDVVSMGAGVIGTVTVPAI